MERRGVYRKGSAGHVRNAGMYRILQEHYKKWRRPIIGMFVLVMVFGIAPSVGDNFQASVLTSEETEELVETKPEAARKVLLDYFHSFIKDCERFNLSECLTTGSALQNELGNKKNDLKTFLPSLEGFESLYMGEVARSACHFDLSESVAQMKTEYESIKEFAEKYAEDSLPEEFGEVSSALQENITRMEELASACR